MLGTRDIYVHSVFLQYFSLASRMTNLNPPNLGLLERKTLNSRFLQFPLRQEGFFHFVLFSTKGYKILPIGYKGPGYVMKHFGTSNSLYPPMLKFFFLNFLFLSDLHMVYRLLLLC